MLDRVDFAGDGVELEADLRGGFAAQAKLEAEMRELEAEKAELDRWLATSEAYADDAKERLRPAVERAGEITWELARREAAWLELAEALDRIDADG